MLPEDQRKIKLILMLMRLIVESQNRRHSVHIIFDVSMMESGTDCVMRGKMKALMLFIGCYLLYNVKAN